MALLKRSVECPAKITTTPLPGAFAAMGLLSNYDPLRLFLLRRAETADAASVRLNAGNYGNL
jgi:hypothetical protein